MRIECCVCDMIRGVQADVADKIYSDYYIDSTEFFVITKIFTSFQIVPKRHVQYFTQLSQDEVYDVQVALSRVIKESRTGLKIVIDQIAIPKDGDLGHLCIQVKELVSSYEKE